MNKINYEFGNIHKSDYYYGFESLAIFFKKFKNEKLVELKENSLGWMDAFLHGMSLILPGLLLPLPIRQSFQTLLDGKNQPWLANLINFFYLATL